jgi:hypothetical protein
MFGVLFYFFSLGVISFFKTLTALQIVSQDPTERTPMMVPYKILFTITSAGNPMIPTIMPIGIAKRCAYFFLTPNFSKLSTILYTNAVKSPTSFK